MKVYTKVNCEKCLALKSVLIGLGMEYEEINDMKELMIIGSKHRIMSAPIIEYNNKFYTYENFLEYLQKVKIIDKYTELLKNYLHTVVGSDYSDIIDTLVINDIESLENNKEIVILEVNIDDTIINFKIIQGILFIDTSDDTYERLDNSSLFWEIMYFTTKHN